MANFDKEASESYAEGPPRQVPGFFDMHKMVSLLLAERVPSEGNVLVLGAGGGLELKALADRHPSWTFEGVDPSSNMIEAAVKTVGHHANRIGFHEGTIEVAPIGPFDAATSILVFHFIPREQRLETLRQLRRRLKLGAPFILIHLSFPQTEPERSLWISRHVAFGASNRMDSASLERARNAISSHLTILSPSEEESMLTEAGFSRPSLFYAGLSIKGWVAFAV